MALFGTPSAYIGVDLGTSTSKIVELLGRRRRVELVTYAEANLENLLVNPPESSQHSIDTTVEALRVMMEKAGTTADSAIAALPGGAVFSTVLMLPQIPESEMEQAIRFAARDVVPADIDDMVLGWGRVGSQPHMATDNPAVSEANTEDVKKEPSKAASVSDKSLVPVFVTAAPKDVVNRYIAVFERLRISLLSLEIETFPLVRSLLSPQAPPTLMIDTGSRATTLHIIDGGIPRVSHTLDIAGHDITQSIVQAANISDEAAEEKKAAFGLSEDQEEVVRTAIESVVKRQGEKIQDLIRLYEQKESKKIAKALLIGGGANLKGLSEYWGTQLGIQTAIGNPWKGLSYPQSLEQVLTTIGPRFGVAVGLAQRGFTQGSL